MAVNLCAANKKTDLHAAHKVLLACFLHHVAHEDGSHTAHKIELACSTRMFSRVTRKFGLSHSTKIQEHMHVAACECQLRRELYCS